jgi:hypothetical protein
MRLRLAATGSLILPLWFWAVPASAGQVSASSEPDVPEKAGKVLRALRITGTAPAVDGRLNDEAWSLAAPASGFVQHEPDNMAAATELTVVHVAYDDRYLYIAVRCDTSDPSQIVAGLGRRDNLPPSDRFVISVDPRHDHQTSYVFQVNPSGVQGDFAFVSDTQVDNDYDAVWEVATALTGQGWSAEFRIPFSQMRFDVPPAGEEAVWGVNFRRELQRRGEQSEWIGKPRGALGIVSRYGHLVFDGAISPPRRIEVLPFGLLRAASSPSRANELGVSGGADLRLGIGTGTTLAATVNPDFGQVEQDPAVLNLSVLETFFPERRAFFLEDSALFIPQLQEFQLFHSRRIGDIAGAAKLVTRGPTWSRGFLTAVTSTDDAAARPEPATSYSVGRIQRTIFSGSSNVGFLGTAVMRSGGADAFAGGVDYNLRWMDNKLFWGGNWAATRTQTSGTMRTGAGGSTTAGYHGKHFANTVKFETYGRDFAVGDLGFHRSRPDKLQGEVQLMATQPDPWSVFRMLHGYLNVRHARNRDGLPLVGQRQIGLNMHFRNFWDVFVWGGRQVDVYDDLDTRGGPAILNPGENYGGVFVGTDTRKTWRVTAMMTAARGDEGRWYVWFGPAATFQPSGRLQASIGAVFNPEQKMAQWVANRETPAGTTDFVYGRFRQHLLDINARATYAFSRDLTLQAFVQPFVAVGDYSDIARLARPRSFEFEPTTISFDPDFNRKSLRANAVLRWEYSRGSALFAVWNTSTTETSRPGAFAAVRDLRGAFSGSGPHVFMVKLSYWQD